MTRKWMILLWAFSLIQPCIFTSFAAESQAPLGLDECFAQALKRSEVVATQTELLNQAEERYSQARGAILPNVSAFGSYLIQDQSTSTSIAPKNQPLARITANQPLFRGFREFAALRQSRDLSSAQEKLKDQATLQLYADTAQSYYNVLSLEQDLKDLATEVELYDKRIRELQDRVRIGRSKISEVLTLQSSLSSLQASRAQVLAQLNTAREAFAFVTGLPANTPLKPLVGNQAPAPLPSPLDAYVSRLGDRPDVQAAQLQVTSAEEGVSIARGAHLPSADLTGNYYLKRYGVNQDVNWDVQASISLPIFAGGVIASQVRQAASVRTQAELALSRSRRLAEQEIGTFYLSLQTDQAQLDALSKARDLAQKNYQQQTKDYRLGLVTNLDVLQALTSFEENERAYDRTRFQAEVDRIRLEIATGKMPK